MRQIGKGHVLVALIIFQDGSWVKTNLSCAPNYGEMDCLIFVSCDWRECRRSLLRTADKCLDDNGKVLNGKKKVFEGWEKKYDIHFMHNSLFDMADDVGLLPVIGLPRDFLQWMVLGLFGYHIVKAILHLLFKTILADAYLSEHCGRKAPVTHGTCTPAIGSAPVSYNLRRVLPHHQ